MANRDQKVNIVDSTTENRIAIKVLGVGGGGNNAVNRMIDDHVSDVEFIAINTDFQVLRHSKADVVLQLGKGLGAGGDPMVGKRTAEDAREEIEKVLEGANMVFITAGMGGGTGTGAAPIIAEIAKKMDILTVGVVTKPFEFEQRKRMKNALSGIDELQKHVDTLIVIPNEKLFSIISEDTSAIDAFKKVDEVLKQAVQGISDIITKDGLINSDFADVKTVMQNKGIAHMGVGRASGSNKEKIAAEMAIKSPLLETTINGASGMLVSFAGGSNLSLMEVNKAAKYITSMTDDEDSDIIFGMAINDELRDEVIVTVIATGIGQQNVYGNPASAKNASSGNNQVDDGANLGEIKVDRVSIPVGRQAEIKPLNNISDSIDDEQPLVIPKFLTNRNKK